VRRRSGFRPRSEVLEGRTLLATMMWASDASGDWDVASDWVNAANPSDQHVPNASDDAVINYANITVTHDTSAADTVDSLVSAANLDISSGSLTIDTTSASQPTSTVSGQFLLSGASLQVLSGNVNLTGGGTISGTITAVAGTNLQLNGQVLTTSSVVSSDGFVEILDSTEAGSFQAAGGTTAQNTSFTGTVVSLGSSLDVYPGTVSFAPAVGGPVTLTTGALTLESGFSTLTGTDSFVANGLLTLQRFAVLSTSGVVDAYGGLTILTGTNDPTVIDGTTLSNHGAATLDTTAGPGPVGLAQGATINNLAGASFAITGPGGVIAAQDNSAVAFNNAGSLTCDVASNGSFGINVPFSNSGSVSVQQGTFNLSTATNSGTVTVASGTTLGASTYTQTAGATILNGATLNGGTYNIDAGSLSGTGTINANVTNGGQVIPGGTGVAGLLTINGNYTQTATGSLNVNLGGTTADSQYNQLAVSGTAALGGTINVALISGFQPALPNTFQVLTYGSSSGNFTAYNGLNLGGGRFLDPVFSPGNLTLDTDQVAISGAPAIRLEGIPISLTGSVTGPSAGNFYAAGFSWTVTQNGNPFQSGSGSTFTFTPNLSATYLVTLTVTDAAGGTGTTSLQIVVAPSIIVLDPTAGGALSLSGNASIKLTGGVFVDSNSSTAISASGNAAVKASVIDVHGGVQKSGNASFSPVATTESAVLSDPLTSLASPSATGLTNYGSKSVSGNSSATVSTGIYSQISVSGNGTLTMNGGIYIIEGGGFSVSGNASVTGSGVLIFNAGSKYPTTGGTYGSIALSGNGSYSLSPPTTGAYAGIVIFQSRDNTRALTLSGNASGMTGTIYAPAAQLAESGNAQLNAAVVVDTLAVSGNGVANTVALNAPSGSVAYMPAQIRAAYGISRLALDGTGQTIAIVDAYDDPSIGQSLDAFDSQFGLAALGPTLYQQYGPASSFLTVLNQIGQATSLPTTDPNGPGTDNWEVEESLDVEWAHAIAPGAQIILVEANSQSLSDLMASVATAASQPGVSVVSMSWGFPEGQAVFAADEAAYDSVFNVPGVTFVASTGDYGAADPEYPAFSPNVVAVGGTSLTLNADGSYNSETGWGYYSNAAGAFIGSGGGISLYAPEPAYQQGVQSTGSRTTPDVSLVADPATGAWIADPYNLDPSNPFEIVGGTSLSAPAWAGLVPIVNQGRAAAGESSLNSSTPTDTQQAL